MRFAEYWLREWVDAPGVTTAQLAEQLTLLGLEVDALERAAPAFSGVVIARIDHVAAHPHADRLRVCRVDDGSGTEREVVCGAPNAAAGLHVPYARPGAALPGGRRIEAGEIRGVVSQGMLCSEQELGLAEASEGLLALPEGVTPGRDFREWAQLDDAVIELDLTPNRGDCLSIRGIAREVALALGQSAQGPECSPVAVTHDQWLPVELMAPAAAPRYAGRVVRGLDATVATPAWMQRRLVRSGIRPLNPVVDVTNYVMLELGQPMHAFDLALLGGEIRVRYAEAGEDLELLDGRTVTPDAETLVIADDTRPVALAGIMGGEATAVSAGTSDVFLESACFLPAAMAGRARRYAAHSESSHRFERGVDPALAVMALERATALLQEICGGEAGPVTDAVDSAHLPRRDPIHLRHERLVRLLGHEPGNERVKSILEGLGVAVAEQDDGWIGEPPTWRYDLAIEADLIEEVARVHGYNRSPRTHPAYAAVIEPLPERRRGVDELRDELVARDYHEAITYSFVDSDLQAELDPEAAALRLANPLSADMDVMRTMLWPGLVGALRHNLNRQQERVRLFEAGLRFPPTNDGGDVRQENALGLVAAGPVETEHWDARRRAVDFYDVKGDVEALLHAAAGPCRFEPASHPALHPGQSARITVDGASVGWIGRLHPALQRRLELTQSPVLAELAVEPLLEGALPAFEPIARHPSIRRDLAIIVDENTPAEAVVGAVHEAAPEELQRAFVFDVYRGKGVDSGRKSFALGLILQGFGRTLTDQEVEDAVAEVLGRLQADFGATLRE